MPKVNLYNLPTFPVDYIDKCGTRTGRFSSGVNRANGPKAAHDDELHHTHRDRNPLPAIDYASLESRFLAAQTSGRRKPFKVDTGRTAISMLKFAFSKARPGETPREALRRMLDDNMRKNAIIGLRELKDT